MSAPVDAVVMAFSYGDQRTPEGYRCGDCDADGVRLYRRYQTMLGGKELRCRACALKEQRRDNPEHESEHTIGWLVAAVPTEDGSTYWGYTSVPDAGVDWWNRLPKTA